MSDYEWLTNINSLDFNDRSVLIIGAGSMSEQYAHALHAMNIKNVTILSRSKQKLLSICKEYKFTPLSGGFEKHLSSLESFDLVIIATPVNLLIPPTKVALEYGQSTILIEKPVSLYSKEIEGLRSKISKQKVRVAYNRIVYPNFHKLRELLKDESEITSCRFSFTEWIHKIDFSKYSTDILSRWGIANSLHVISMAYCLIGNPRDIIAQQAGDLEWHPSGAHFYGIGITEKNIPFSYHSDWQAPGRWGIDIMTRENIYRLMPLEKLYRCPKNSVNWEEVSFQTSYPNIKLGVAEEIAIMLDRSKAKKPDLVTLESAIEYCEIAEHIFGYNTINKV